GRALVRRRPLGAALLGLGLFGCTVGPNYQRPPVTMPEQYYGAAAVSEARSLADSPWWDVFQDPVLQRLVEEALQKGFDARLAAARVEEARALYGVARGDLWPGVAYQGGFDRTRIDQVTRPESPIQTKWTAKVGFQWELDLFGRIRRQNEAALARYLATEEARRGVLLALVSDVAIAYFELRELDTELLIARRTTAAFQDTFDLFDRQLKGGTVSALESSRAEASLGQVSAQIPEIERAIVAKENEINFLLGRGPQPIPRDGDTPVPPDVPAGLPSDLLERRPDLREAEQLLVAANAGIGVAKAAYFPRLNLTGYFGNVSSELEDIFSGGKTYSFAAGLLGPIFSAGQIKKNYEASKARYEQAAVQYDAAVAGALSEVSRTLVDRVKLVETERHRARAVGAYKEAVRLANKRYASGLSAYFEVLDAQQALYPAEISLARTHLDQLVAVANLYKALGGGWQQEAKPAP
ncbi:MAG TPA: efflux transporter outer membrane subunit, partial [Vicinamibacteria bacterium]|nr:efflux transporter outer membrane subunit [Vicinamibacteria bacterium]